MRNDEIHNIRITLQTLIEENTAPAQGPNRSRVRFFGLHVREINAEDQFDLNLENRNGVLVSKVQRLSPAAFAGLKTDDVIIMVDHSPVTEVNSFYEQLANYKKEVLMLAIKRSKQRHHFFLRNPKTSFK